MIGTIDIKVNAAHPNLPLMPLYAFVGSPSQVRVINVPKAIGNWKLTAVFVTANYPDNTSQSVEATLTGGCWHATLPAPTATGSSVNGFTISANGVKEDGTTAVTGYVLGKGDCVVLDTDSTITVGGVTYYVHLVNSTPATPHKGDLDLTTMKLFDGTAWRSFADSAGVAWANVTGKPQWIVDAGNAKPTYTAAEVGAAAATHASTHAAGGTDAITPAAIGAATASDISGAVTAHDEDDDAHRDKFGEVMDAISDRPTTWSVIQALAAKANVSDFSLPSGGGAPSAQYVASLFSSANTSLSSTIQTKIDATVGAINSALDTLNGEVA